MPVYVGNQLIPEDATSIYVGGTSVTAIYVGSTLVWQSTAIGFDPSTVTTWLPAWNNNTSSFNQSGTDGNGVSGTRLVTVTTSIESEFSTEAIQGDQNADGDTADSLRRDRTRYTATVTVPSSATLGTFAGAYGSWIVTNDVTPPDTFSGLIAYVRVSSVSVNSASVGPFSYSDELAGATINYSVILDAGFDRLFDSTGTAQITETGFVTVPSNGGNIEVDLTSLTTSEIFGDDDIDESRIEAVSSIAPGGQISFAAGYTSQYGSQFTFDIAPASAQTDPGYTTSGGPYGSVGATGSFALTKNLVVDVAGTIPTGFYDAGETFSVRTTITLTQPAQPLPFSITSIGIRDADLNVPTGGVFGLTFTSSGQSMSFQPDNDFIITVNTQGGDPNQITVQSPGTSSETFTPADLADRDWEGLSPFENRSYTITASNQFGSSVTWSITLSAS